MATIEGMSKSRLTRLSTSMQGYIDRGEVAGVVTLVHRHGREVHSDAFGWQDEEAGTPIGRDTNALANVPIEAIVPSFTTSLPGTGTTGPWRICKPADAAWGSMFQLALFTADHTPEKSG